MRNYIYILSFACTIVLFSNCSPKEYPLGKYQNTQIIADGDASDWGLPLRFGNETGSLQYAITNDKENIYISIASNEQVTQMKMLRAGIKIYIDPNGKKATDMCISYPYKEAMDMPRNRNENRNTDPTAMKQKMLMDADIFSTSGFINMENRIYDLKDTSHIKVGMNYDTYNNLVFEAIIPIKNVLNNPITNKKAPSISLGIMVNNMGVGPGQRPNVGNEMSRNEGAGMGGGMRGGGMGRGGMSGGGMSGGGMRGGGMSRGGGMRGGGMSSGANGSAYNANNKPISNWYQFKLAYQAE